MRRRSGFTLTELLVVIAILLVLSTMAFAIFNSGRSSDRMRSGARTAQSAFLGAKDRALHAKDLRGVRLTRDATNLNLLNGFVYLQSLGTLTYPLGSIQLERTNLISFSFPDSPDVLIVHGFDGLEPGPTPASPYVDWAQKSAFFAFPGRIRIPAGSGGQWFSFFANTSGAYKLQPGNEYLQLATSFPQAGNPFAKYYIAFDRATAFSSCDIQLGNDVLPFHQPITLPSGCVIDLAYCSSNVQIMAGYVPQIQAVAYIRPGYVPVPPMNNIDVMFSPRGNLTGTVSALGALFFCLRGVQDASLGLDPAYNKQDPVNYPQTPGDCLILAVFPQTGLVQTYDADLTDAFINATGAAGADGAADNIFNFAQRGQSAGR